MPKEQRVIIFVGTLVLLLIVYLALRNPFEVVGNKGIVILSCLIMLSFTVFLAEHFFTRPTDVIASSVSILLILAPMHESLKETGNWYWVFFGYNSMILIIALVSLLFLDRDKPEDAISNRISAIAKVIAVRFGNGRFLWFTFFALCVLFYVDSQSSLFIILLAYAIILLLIDPKKAIIQISSLTTNTDTAVASLFGIQSQNIFLARIYPNGPYVSKLNIVGFASSIGGRKDWIAGLVIETYELNAQRWMKILVDDSFNEFKNKNIKPKLLKRGVVHLLSLNGDLSIVKRLAGTVSAASTIDKLKFEYAFNASVEEGDLLEVCCGEIMVLYQVVEGVTGIESLESRDEAGVTIGEAIQLGSWNSENRSFDRYGWVPNINRPVFKAQGVESIQPLSSEYQIGTIPGTNFPIFINRELAVTHHLAVLGVTGSGKSVFARNLIRQIASSDTKVICVDFTNEYKVTLGDLIGEELLSAAISASLFDSIDQIGDELEKFPNQRNKSVLATHENILREGFKNALNRFVIGNTKATLFELPDVANTAGILDYTKWFFKALFELAKSNQLAGKKVCVVLEEAHTIIPEWSFIGTEDKRAGSVVNSISQIALQGRKYGVGFVVIAQRTANVSKNVLTQCNSIVAFQQFDRTSAEFLGNYMGKDFLSSLPRLRHRHAIAVGKAFSSGTPTIFKVPDIEESSI